MPRQRFHWQKHASASRSDLVIRSELPQWIIKVLRESGVKRISLLARLSDEDLLAVPGIGLRSLAVIRAELARVEGEDGASHEAAELQPHPASTEGNRPGADADRNA